MDSDILKGKWKQYKGMLKDRWGKLTDNDVNQIEGKIEILAGKLQEKYGLTKEKALQDINEFLGEYMIEEEK